MSFQPNRLERYAFHPVWEISHLCSIVCSREWLSKVWCYLIPWQQRCGLIKRSNKHTPLRCLLQRDSDGNISLWEIIPDKSPTWALIHSRISVKGGDWREIKALLRPIPNNVWIFNRRARRPRDKWSQVCLGLWLNSLCDYGRQQGCGAGSQGTLSWGAACHSHTSNNYGFLDLRQNTCGP